MARGVFSATFFGTVRIADRGSKRIPISGGQTHLDQSTEHIKYSQD